MTRLFAPAAATSLAVCILLAAAPVMAGDDQPSPLETVRAVEDVIVDVAEGALPSVVLLDVHGSMSTGHERWSPLDGLGSGFILDTTGRILTNHHVIAGADRIDVILADGRTYRGEVIVSSEEADVGLIRITNPPKNLPVAVLGDSGALRPGQFALALGAPMGFDRSVTVGHVSALHRTDIGRRIPGTLAPGFEKLSIQDFIQVDTSINPGNSGGPLLNLDGEVVGINTAIAAAPGGGLGFAVPIQLALRIVEELETTGELTLPWLGVREDDNNSSLDEVFDRQIGQGALIKEVFDDSPAASSRLAPDDVVVGFNGRKIRSRHDLRSAIAVSPVGEAVDVILWRSESGDDVRKVLKVVLEKRPASFDQPVAAAGNIIGGELAATDSSFMSHEMGMALESPSREINDKLGRKPSAGGVVVQKVAPNSLASEAGLQPGDVLLEVSGVEVGSPAEVTELLRGARRDFLPLVVEREGEKKYFSVERPR